MQPCRLLKSISCSYPLMGMPCGLTPWTLFAQKPSPMTEITGPQATQKHTCLCLNILHMHCVMALCHTCSLKVFTQQPLSPTQSASTALNILHHLTPLPPLPNVPNLVIISQVRIIHAWLQAYAESVDKHKKAYTPSYPIVSFNCCWILYA